MKRRLLYFTVACSSIMLLNSCHTSEKAVANHPSRQPRFINNIYIDPHAKTGATANAIDPRRPKPVQRPQRSHPIASTSKATYEPAINTIAEPSLKRKYAELLGVAANSLSNYSLYQFIDKWIGANYRLGGCDKSGIDCSGFAQKLYGEVYGIDLVRTAMEQFGNCQRIKPKDAAEGDLVFFHIGSRRRITHVGIYLANNYFVHASTTGGVMISNLTEDYWRRSYAGIGRVPKS